MLAGGECGGELAGLAGLEGGLFLLACQTAAGGVEALNDQGKIPVVCVAPRGGQGLAAGRNRQLADGRLEGGGDGAGGGLRLGESRKCGKACRRSDNC